MSSNSKKRQEIAKPNSLEGVLQDVSLESPDEDEFVKRLSCPITLRRVADESSDEESLSVETRRIMQRHNRERKFLRSLGPLVPLSTKVMGGTAEDIRRSDTADGTADPVETASPTPIRRKRADTSLPVFQNNEEYASSSSDTVNHPPSSIIATCERKTKKELTFGNVEMVEIDPNENQE